LLRDAITSIIAADPMDLSRRADRAGPVAGGASTPRLAGTDVHVVPEALDRSA